MSVPFTKFRVQRNYIEDRLSQTVYVEFVPEVPNSRSDEPRKFIEDAILEKMQREGTRVEPVKSDGHA